MWMKWVGWVVEEIIMRGGEEVGNDVCFVLIGMGELRNWLMDIGSEVKEIGECVLRCKM